jgi:3-dehydroquinate synthase
VTGYSQVLHGEAVAFGMVVESRMAAARGLLPVDTLDRILSLLRTVGLPTTAAELGTAVDGELLLEAVDRIRMIRGGGHRFVLPMAVGETVIADDVAAGELRAALADCGIDLSG